MLPRQPRRARKGRDVPGGGKKVPHVEGQHLVWGGLERGPPEVDRHDLDADVVDVVRLEGVVVSRRCRGSV